MKVKVTLPKGYGRAYAGADRFEKSIPTFNVMAFDNNGNAVQEPYPTRVKMGPEMYDFLSRIMPRLAARHGEDLNYEGIVEENRDRKPKHKYIYYGYGNNPFSVGGTDNYPIGPIGYGDEERPKNIGTFGYINGKPNYLYSLLADAPSPLGLETKSQVLTNILNDSWDFSPLLAPIYKFKDMEYDPENDPDEKGPRPTDHWVPRFDESGKAMINPETGKPIWMPIPLVQDMPIYNLKYPLWEENPEAAWSLIHDPTSAIDWKTWNKAPSYADYTGMTSRTEGGEIRPRDYLLANSRLAEKPGYFEDYPELKPSYAKDKAGVYTTEDKDFSGFKNNAHENLRDVKGQRSVEKINEAHEEESKKFEDAHLKEMQQKAFDDAKNFNKNHLRPEDAMVNRASNKDMKAFYRAVVGKAFFDQNKPLLEVRGITPEEKNAVYHYAKDQGWEKYNKIPDDETKMIYILDDYAKNKKDREQQDNILAGVKEPF